MEAEKFDRKTFVRRTKLYVPANRDKFVAKAWTRGADCIILDLKTPSRRGTRLARGMVKDDIPMVRRGGADVQVRINREFERGGPRCRGHPGVTP